MKQCPFCKQSFNYISRSHLSKCSKDSKVTDYKEARYLMLCCNFPEISNKDILIREYETNLLSLVDIKKKYQIDFKSTQFLLNYYNIHIRGISESALKITVPKANKTNLENLGCTNVLSKDTPAYHKRNQTMIDKYGVDSVMKTEYFKHRNKSDDAYIEHFGLTKKEFNSERVKKIWNNKSEEEKKQWLINSIHNDKAIRNAVGYTISKLEKHIEELLQELSITYETQLLLKVSNKKRYFYDLYITSSNLIIEIQGDYWHANPNRYSAEDLVHYKFADIKAQDIWDRDKVKQDFAISKGYKVVSIWEHFIKNTSKEDLKQHLITLINGKES
jgi:very-short-patch-repair endonuclease